MRVIAGKAKGLILKVPKGLQIRPTAEKVREAIFSSISNRIQGARVLDLFAGSGALGIEALSRHAQTALFVDSSFIAIETIRNNVKHTGFEKRAQTIKSAAESFLHNYKKLPFDLIFIDAPYRIGLIKLEGIVNLAFKVLVEGGILIAEHSSKLNLGPDSRMTHHKKYGQTLVTFFKKE